MDFVKREEHNLVSDEQYKAYLESLQKTHQMDHDYQHTPMTIEQLHQLQTSLGTSSIVHNFQLPLSPRHMSTLMLKTNHLTRNDLPVHLQRNLTDIDLQNLQNLSHEIPCRPEDLVLTQNLGRNLDLARNLTMDLELQNSIAQSLMHNITEQELARNANLNRINEVVPQNLSHDVELSHLNRQAIEQEILSHNERRPIVINNIIHDGIESNLNQRPEENINQRLDPNLVQRMVAHNQPVSLHEMPRTMEQNEQLMQMQFHIKSEQEDDGYFYENINQDLNVNGINGHVAAAINTDSQSSAAHAQDAQIYLYPPNTTHHSIPALNPIEVYSRPQNYIQNYNRDNPQNLVVHRQFENNSPYQEEFKEFKKFRQDGGEENGAKLKEQPKENLKPSDENKIYYVEFNNQNVYQNSDKSDQTNENKLTGSDDISMIKGEYVCYKCNEVFSSKRGLKQHAKACSESGDQDVEKQGKFSCSQCAYRCQSPAILKIHERVHSGEKPFSCTFCSYKSGQKNNVAKHMLVHMNQKPFRCQYCEYRCAQKNNLVVHERTHTGFKPFACPYCDYRTVQKPNLVKHMYLHTDQKPFSCDQCNYRCVQKTNLTKHKQRHLNEKDGDKAEVKNLPKPYRPRQKSVKCPHCPYKCVQKASLEKHMQFKHPDLSQEIGFVKEYEPTVQIDENPDAIQNLSVKKDEITSFNETTAIKINNCVPVEPLA